MSIKNNTMTFNGFIIQGKAIEWIERETNYIGGASKESWILDGYDDPKAIALSKKVNSFFNVWYEVGKTFSLWVCPDFRLVVDYFKYCQVIKVDVRLLLCQSKRDEPKVPEGVIEILKSKMKLLGYDYVSPSFDYSTLSDELFINVHKELRKFRKMLNENGLFPSQELLNEYINHRTELINKEGDFEDSIDCCEVAIYLCDLNFEDVFYL